MGDFEKKENSVLELLKENKVEFSGMSFQMMIYLCFIPSKKIGEREAKFFSPSKDCQSDKVDEAVIEKYIENLRLLRKSLKEEIKTYENFILLCIKNNILKLKQNQLLLEEKEKKKISFAQGENKKKLENLNLSIFGIDTISNLVDFKEFLEKTEPLYLKTYRNKNSYNDFEFLEKINEMNFTEENLEKLAEDFFNNKIFLMQDEITGELYMNLLEFFAKKIKKNRQGQERDTFFSLLLKITSIELRAFNTLSKGVDFAL